MTHSFAIILYLSICMLGKCSCFYFCLLTFFKIKFLQINHQGPPLECQTVWIKIKTDILLLFIWVQTVCKMAIGRRLSKYYCVQYIVSYRCLSTWIYMYMYTMNIRSLSIHFDMLCPLNKAKVILKGSS